MTNTKSRWRLACIAAAMLSTVSVCSAAETIRIAVPTKGYWSTAVAMAAQEKKLFEKEGIQGEVTIFRSGADCFQALVADAADIALGPPSLVAAGMRRGVGAKVVGIGSSAPLGWHLVVLAKSPVKSVKELAGKKVGISSSGSLSDLLARWSMSQSGTQFSTVPLGGGGTTPNLRAGNIDATVLYSPITYQLLASGEIRSLQDYTQDMPRSAVDTWIASEAAIAKRKDTVRKGVKALFAAVAALHADPDYAIKLIAKNGELSEEVAKLEYEKTFKNLPAENKMDLALIDKYLEFARVISDSEPPPARDIALPLD